jgi:uncharacterized protein (TIGR00290 family)
MTLVEPVVLSWSGGKDSSLALAALRDDPSIEVVALMTTVTPAYDRISIHGVRRSLLRQQAESLRLPLLEVVLDPQSSNEAYEAAFAKAAAEVRDRFPEARRIAFGDLYLEEVREYRERLLATLGFAGLFPLWGKPTDSLAREFIDRGFAARLVCVDTTQLGAEFTGRVFDHALLRDLPASCDPCGEGGEFHTFVSSGPVFATPIPYDAGEIVLRDGRFSYCDLVPSSAAQAVSSPPEIAPRLARQPHDPAPTHL